MRCSCRSINQAVGPLAVSQIDVDDGYIGSALGNQALGVRYGGSRTGYIRSQYTKQTLHGIAECQESSTSRMLAPFSSDDPDAFEC